MRGTIPAGVSIPMHSHADPETFVMMSGTVEGLIDRNSGFEWVGIHPGEIFHVPGNAKHAWRNPGKAPRGDPALPSNVREVWILECDAGGECASGSFGADVRCSRAEVGQWLASARSAHLAAELPIRKRRSLRTVAAVPLLCSISNADHWPNASVHRDKDDRQRGPGGGQTEPNRDDHHTGQGDQFHEMLPLYL